MPITETIAAFIAGTDGQFLPAEGLRVAKKHLLDCLGVAVAGCREPAVEILAGYIEEAGGRPQATMIGRPQRSSTGQAALINGVSAHVLDYDDCAEHGEHSSWLGHPTAAMLPAILALAESQRSSGRECLAAYLIGFEVGGKIGLGVGHRHYDLGWHTTSTIGTMGAAAAAARLLRLDVERTRTALGIAGSLASGLRQNFGTMTKPLHAGLAARNGVLAAGLAGRGFSADRDLLEAPAGFARIMSGGHGDDSSKMIQGLGDPWAIVAQGPDLKPYPCCRFTHRCIDAVLCLKSRHRFDPRAVREILCATSPILRSYLIHDRPATSLEAKFSLQYCTAVALLDGCVGLGSFAPERIARNDVQDLLIRVRYHHPRNTASIAEALDEPEEVTLRLDDGRVFSHSVAIARGDFRNPLSEDEVITKFHSCTEGVFSRQRRERLIECVLGLETVEDISTLTGLLVP